MTQAESIGTLMIGLAFLVSFTVGIITIIRFSREKSKQDADRAEAQIKASEAQIKAFEGIVTDLQIVMAAMGENFKNQNSLLTKFDKRLVRVENEQNDMKVNCARQGHYKKVRDET